MNFDWLLSAASFIGNTLRSIWEWFIVIVPTIDAICMSFIAYYTFRLTIFPKKLKFINFKQGRSTFDGDSVELTLENRSLCPCVVESVDLIVGSHKIKYFEGEYIIDGFKTAKIAMQPYSKILSEDGEIDIDILTLKDISLLVKTTRGIQHIKYERISRLSWWRIRRLESKYKPTTVCRNYHNQRLVVPGIRYALSFLDEEKQIQTILIHRSGMMSQPIFGYNYLSAEIMKDKISVKKHFDAEFSKCGLTCFLTEFEDTFLTEIEE